MKFSRTGNSLLNIGAGLLLQVLTIALGFFSRKIFVDTLGFQILGINGLFINIVAVLSLAELGIGFAIICNLYKPLATSDHKTLRALMQFYAKVYNFLAMVVAALALLLLPFVHLLVKEAFDISYLRIIFALFVAETVLSYLFVYKRSIIVADQQNYLLNIITAVIQTIRTLSQIGILYYTHNYILFLSVNLVFRLIENLSISRLADKLYPFLRESEAVPLEDDLYRNIIGNTKSLIFHFSALYLVNSTDSIIISSSIGVVYVGKLVNYQMIMNGVYNLFNQFANGIISSFGNLLALEEPARVTRVFYSVFYGNFLLYNFASVALINLTNPFICLWLGNKALFPISVVCLLVCDFFLLGITSISGSLRASAGVFQPDKYYHLGASALKIFVSIGLVGRYGVEGVLLGTVIYRFIEWYCVLGWTLHRFVFKSSLMVYAKKSAMLFAIAVLSQVLTYMVCTHIVLENPWAEWFLKAFACFLLPNIIGLVFLFKTEEIGYLINRIKAHRLFKVQNIEGTS